jgi:hypothetical protein
MNKGVNSVKTQPQTQKAQHPALEQIGGFDKKQLKHVDTKPFDTFKPKPLQMGRKHDAYVVSHPTKGLIVEEGQNARERRAPIEGIIKDLKDHASEIIGRVRKSVW